MLSLLSDYFWYGWLIIPGFALYKLWSGIIAPWIFAPAAEVPGGSQVNYLPYLLHIISKLCSLLPLLHLEFNLYLLLYLNLRLENNSISHSLS